MHGREARATARRGDRVRLIRTTDPYTHLRPGDLGTVAVVDDLGTVHVAWDDGSSLGLVPGEDRWECVEPSDQESAVKRPS